ncbi:hypothetical protein AAC387_Pa02g1955 [Persea americana]
MRPSSFLLLAMNAAVLNRLSPDAPADKIGSLDDYIGNASDDDAAPGPISAKPDKYVAPTNDAPPVPPPSPGTNHTSGAQSGSRDGAYYAVKASTLVVVAGVVSCFFSI